MRKYSNALALCAAVAMVGTARAETPRGKAKGPGAKLADATAVYRELTTTADKAVPKELLARAKCIAVLPGVIKAAVGFGARHGSGVISCRTESGWSTPAFISISGGSWGLQLGAESSDIALFFMNDRGAHSLVDGSRVTLGGQASVAAGPFGRSAEAATNLDLKAEIYSYAKSKGLFAGVSLEGAELKPDEDDNRDYYGSGATTTQLLFGGPPANVPAEARTFQQALP
ncbi:MAG TPA: lipid-binding SYLF domain-containing protein [Gemmatimonadaceae bacterium]|nr:lipid-binding SYLF domain-containing protein [Gemmatimonadaceae bacterium]